MCVGLLHVKPQYKLQVMYLQLNEIFKKFSAAAFSQRISVINPEGKNKIAMKSFSENLSIEVDVKM